jgi:3-oxoadipate enol-lactonase
MGFGDRMAELLRHVTTDRKPYVVGNGFGSFVALQMVIRHPDLVEKLVMAAGGVGFTDEGRQAFRNMIGGAQAKGLAGIADVAMRRLFAPEFQAANPEIMADRRAAFLKMNPAVFVSACTALSQMDLRAEAAKVTVPILALCGEEDEATPPAMSKELAEIVPGTRLILLPGCAHVPQMQKPKEFLDAIDGFLN